MRPVELDRFIEDLKARKDTGPNVAYHRAIPEKQAEWAALPRLRPELEVRLKHLGLEKAYSHQARAVEAALSGRNVIVATPTASGKTLCYMAPVINALLEDPEATAIFLFPLKALEHDQLKAFRELADALPADTRAEIFDGDTSQSRRRRILADPPRVIFTNPDMLHLSILPYHGKWEAFLKKLRYVVIDETHTYRGVFGSHMAQVLRRLDRILAHYGAAPVYIASSATISNPAEFARGLTGKEFTVIGESGSPRPGGHFIVYNTDASPYTDASKIFRAAIRAGLKTIAFTKARKITELIYHWTAQADPEIADKVSCYRAGFLPEERRQIERDLFTGRLDGVVSTSALEMGVDIGGLDVCVLVGYPGTIINTWQRGGRVGRGDRQFLIILVAQPDALDQYFVHHPDELFTRQFEAAIIDPGNEPILKSHITCAAAELAIEPGGAWFAPENHRELFEELAAERRLVQSADGDRWLCPRKYPHRDVRIRAIGESYSIFLQDGKTVIGAISGSRVYSEGHKGAVYLHKGTQYLVTDVDYEKKSIFVKPMDERYYTRPRTDKDTEILETLREKKVNGFSVKLGRLKVTEQVTGYEKRSIFGQDSLGVFDLDSPKTEFQTVGFWVEIEDPVRLEIENRRLGYMGGIHAFEHAAIALFPLFALCDRDDIGGISFPLYPGLGKSAVFFYDGYPGGLGLCEAGFEKVDELWKATLKLVADCPCDTGCPSCVHSPKCGSGNKPLDKMAAVTVMEYLCGLAPMPGEATAVAAPPRTQPRPAPVSTDERGEFYDPAPDRRILFFDLETQKSAEDVGGWGNIPRMGLAVAVVYDSREKAYLKYWEDDVDALVEKLLSADLVVGFNHIRFDYAVLSAYTRRDLPRNAKSFDILADIKERLDFRLSLGHLCEATLGRPKTADGLVSLQWWKEGKRDQVADYCQVDVELTKELFEYGLENGHLLYTLKSGETVRLPLDWELEKIIEQAAKPPAPKKRRLRF